MTLFWTLAALALLVALVLLALPLLKRRSLQADYTSELNITIARERLVEIEAEKKRGELSDEEYDQAKLDLEIALAQDIAGKDAAVPVESQSEGAGRMALVATVVILPILSIGLYQHLGSPQHMGVAGPGAPQQTAQNPHSGVAGNAGEMQTMDEHIKSLKQRLQENPQDGEGWLMLARVYSAMQRYQDAVDTLEQLRELSNDHPVVLVKLADAVAMTQGGSLKGRPEELTLKALESDPNNATGLWLAGTAASQSEDYAKAVSYWQRARLALADNPQLVAELDSQIQRASANAKQAGIEIEEMAPAVASTPAGITLRISLSEGLSAKVKPTDTLFVFAKAVDGPPMPLAAIRRQAGEMPLDVVLSDADFLRPGMGLADFDQLNIGARVALGGQPMAQSGDLQSAQVVVKPADDFEVSLLIDQVVP